MVSENLRKPRQQIKPPAMHLGITSNLTYMYNVANTNINT